ncbi:6-phosphogluconolactonase [Paenibacillus marchantiophytorum]|uniref:6-phosphogluconolactonase n=1 Tax=Paenibacillus marchantiophytorum TaxID=1619310 RepID=A0ABQ1ER97_9BACL|nr:lactonase family protein [Paenibacillus marchantiophytorum]GFZ83204.1 6-phosphogluconolactonase [Paenibacillus marchantiophytorum]
MTIGGQKEQFLYVGSYTDEQNQEGIRLYSLNSEHGELTLVAAYHDLPNASFLALNDTRSVLYAVSETVTYNGGFGGAAAAYAIQAGTWTLEKINQQPTDGSAPCYISLDKTNRIALVANYGSGDVTVYPIEDGGGLGAHSPLVKHEGALGPQTDRQEAPHAHSIVPSPNNRFAISADLGLDRLMVSRIDAERGILLPHGEAVMKPGAGPRHLVYSADSRYVYAINELDSTISVLGFEADAGVLTALQSIETLPEGFSGESTCADIHLSGDGRFLYASNRGHDSIAVYAVDRESGTLSVVGWQATLGRTPRNFALSPQGDYLLAANQDSSSITVFRIDAETGMLQETGQSAAVARPVCIKFL